MDFSSFKLTECGTSAQTRVAEGRRTENGIHVEYYISTQVWDNGSRDYHEFRRIVRAFDGDDILYRRLCGLFDNCGVGGWADFYGKNPPYVLDGESMSFCLVLPANHFFLYYLPMYHHKYHYLQNFHHLD